MAGVNMSFEKGMKKMEKKLVTVIIPCRNEAPYIAGCLESVIAQDYPKDKLEVFVMNGMSNDGTREIVGGFSSRYSFIKLIDNRQLITPCAFNIGIKHAKGYAIIILGAHAAYSNDYISRCVAALLEQNADNVGGKGIMLPSDNGLVARAIATSLGNPLGSGNAVYKNGIVSKIKEVDTVFGGCYRRSVFDRIGLFNEKLRRTQDIDLNIRLKKNGGKIIFDPNIVSYYFARGKIKDFIKNNFESGYWVIYSRKFTKNFYKARHYIPMIFLSFIIGFLLLAVWEGRFLILLGFIMSLYFLVLLAFSLAIVIKGKDPRFIVLLPAIFFLRHASYGLGSLLGAVKLLLPS
jgi:glycosyltransferase involved in cell wall biosynthesis